MGRILFVGVFVVAASIAACADEARSDRGGRASVAGDEAFGTPETVPPAVPLGLAVHPVTLAVTPTAMTFSPDGDTLYVASLAGFVFAYPVLGGVLLGPPIPFASGLSMPLGVAATDDEIFVSVVQGGAGAVIRATDENGDLVADRSETVLGGLPIGRHNTNGLAIGPDGMLYVLNGSSSDSGFRDEGGPAETPPFGGSLLRVDPAATGLVPTADMVVATGWRNPFDLAFVPSGHPSLPDGDLFVTMNGPDGETYAQPGGGSIARPTGEDTLSQLRVDDEVVEHFGFPWCLVDRDREGLAGFAQDPNEGTCDPLPDAAFAEIPGQSKRATPVAAFGTHVSSNGASFNPGGSLPAEFDGDLFVAQFGSNPGGDLAGHKLVRVSFDDDGNVSGVADFLAMPAPLALTFGPAGALWIADLSGLVVRVAGLPGL